jgi:DNA-binding CsgD family transcriptional regulator/PAS domain-containing protein
VDEAADLRNIENAFGARLDNVIAGIYLSGATGDGWRGCLERIVRTTGGQSGVLGWTSPEAEQQEPVWCGHAPEFRESFERLYALQSPVAPVASFAGGTVFRLEELAPRAILTQSRFYREWLRPQRIAGALCALLHQGGMGREIRCTVFRHEDAPDFAPRDVAAFQLFVRHLQRAFDIDRQLAGVRQERDAANEIHDFLAIGVILLDDRGRIVRVNRRARRFLDEKDGLTLNRDGLRAATASDTAQLQRAIAAASTGLERPALRAIPIHRPSGLPALVADVVPIAPSRTGFAGPGGAGVAVLLRATDSMPDAAADRLCDAFRLTPAEGRLCARLAAGHSLEQCADDFGIKIGTARNQLKRIFVKTETHRQAELVHRVITALAP